MGVVGIGCDIDVFTIPLDVVPIRICLRHKGSLVSKL